MLLIASGFPKNGYYTTVLLRPDNKTRILDNYDGNGRFDKDGQPSKWNLDCYGFHNDVGGLPPGKYTLNLTDQTNPSPTHGKSLSVVFDVGY